MVRVLIVGAGLTGSLCAHMLRKHLPTKLQCQIIVWEKSQGAGGRMATFRYLENKKCIAELGAQYLEQHENYLCTHQTIYNELLEFGVIKPFEGRIGGFRGEKLNTFMSPNGLSAIAKHFLSTSSAEVYYNQKLESLRLISEDLSNDWTVWEAATEMNKHDHFDAVIVTSPARQTLGLVGVRNYLSEDQVNDLEKVEYSSRFAIGLFYKAGRKLPDLPYDVEYVSGNKIICFFAIDSRKRGVPDEEGASIIAHTNVPFGVEHLEEDKEIVGPIVLEELKKLIPGLPDPDHVRYHKWRFSQVTKPADSSGCMVVTKKPLLLFAGDAFTHSNVDGCIQSALKVEEEIVKWIENA